MGLSLAYNAWLRSGYVSNARGAYRLDSVGGGSYDYTDYRYSVRPALHLFAENLLQTIPEFGSFKNDRLNTAMAKHTQPWFNGIAPAVFLNHELF